MLRMQSNVSFSEVLSSQRRGNDIEKSKMVRRTDNGDVFTNHRNVWSSEMTQGGDSSDRGAVQHVSFVVQEMQINSYRPDLVHERECRRQILIWTRRDSHSERTRSSKLTFCPATMHSASLSTAFDLRRAFSNSLVMTTSSSDCLLNAIYQSRIQQPDRLLHQFSLVRYDSTSVALVIVYRDDPRVMGSEGAWGCGRSDELPSRFEI